MPSQCAACTETEHSRQSLRIPDTKHHRNYEHLHPQVLTAVFAPIRGRNLHQYRANLPTSPPKRRERLQQAPSTPNFYVTPVLWMIDAGQAEYPYSRVLLLDVLHQWPEHCPQQRRTENRINDAGSISSGQVTYSSYGDYSATRIAPGHRLPDVPADSASRHGIQSQKILSRQPFPSSRCKVWGKVQRPNPRTMQCLHAIAHSCQHALDLMVLTFCQGKVQMMAVHWCAGGCAHRLGVIIKHNTCK